MRADLQNSDALNNTRFLALVLPIASAYSWATMHGQQTKQIGVAQYAERIQEHHDKLPRQSDFGLSLDSQRWLYAMELWADWARQQIALKPHKQLYFQ